MISNSLMQITLIYFLFKKCNIIRKGIINKDRLTLYDVFLHLKYTQQSAVKAIIKQIKHQYLKQTHLR